MDCLRKANLIISKMPSEHDRLDRHKMLIDIATDIDMSVAKKLIQDAFRTITGSSDTSLKARRKQLIDLAYRIDKDLPASLASIIDDDPARSAVKSEVKAKQQREKIRQVLSDEKTETPSRVDDNNKYADTAWELLGELNAGRISAIHIDKIRAVLMLAKNMPLNLAFPLIAYAYENIIRVYGSGVKTTEYIHRMFHACIQMVTLAFMILERSSAIDKKSRWATVTSTNRMAKTIEPGNRQQAIDWIRDWIIGVNDPTVSICDPYFSVEDLELVRLIQQCRPEARVTVFGDLALHKKDKRTAAYADTYYAYWQNHITHDDPPTLKVILCATTSGKFPVHDRWIITPDSGLRLGTSFHSIGEGKLSEISTMREEEVLEVGQKLARYLAMEESFLNGERLQYEAFTVI